MAVKLSSSQKAIAREIVRIGVKRKVGPKLIKAALETGFVESNFTNSPTMTDHDSQGWRQERASLYKDPTNLKASINRFYDEALTVRKKYGRAGDVAAAVQRPASQYRGRYQQRAGDAAALMAQLAGGNIDAGSGATTRSAGSPATVTVTPGALQAPADPSAIAAAVAPKQPQGMVGSSTPLVAPQTVGPTFSKTALQVQSAPGAPRAAQSGVDVLLAAAAAAPRGAVPQGPTVTVTPGTEGAPAASSSRSSSNAKLPGGKVIVAPGAERPGHGLQKPILGLLHRISAVSGRPVTVTTGTNHSTYTVDGNLSDHGPGNAADLGVNGDARQDAAASKKGDLIAAHAIQVVTGMKFSKALAVARQGGIHNFNTKQGRVQVIWKTLAGGNHFNHVHVGLNPNRR